jgi:hypothetical protein
MIPLIWAHFECNYANIGADNLTNKRCREKLNTFYLNTGIYIYIYIYIYMS